MKTVLFTMLMVFIDSGLSKKGKGKGSSGDYDCSCCEFKDGWYEYDKMSDYEGACPSGYHLPRYGDDGENGYETRMSKQCMQYPKRNKLSSEYGAFLLYGDAKRYCRDEPEKCKTYTQVCIKDKCGRIKPTESPTAQPTPTPTKKKCIAEWSDWSEWSQCTITDYGCKYPPFSKDCQGFKYRERRCIRKVYDDYFGGYVPYEGDDSSSSGGAECECYGDSYEETECGTNKCLTVSCDSRGYTDCNQRWSMKRKYDDYEIANGDYSGNPCIDISCDDDYRFEVYDGCGAVYVEYDGQSMCSFDYTLHGRPDDFAKKYFDVRCYGGMPKDMK